MNPSITPLRFSRNVGLHKFSRTVYSYQIFFRQQWVNFTFVPFPVLYIFSFPPLLRKGKNILPCNFHKAQIVFFFNFVPNFSLCELAIMPVFTNQQLVCCCYNANFVSEGKKDQKRKKET